MKFVADSFLLRSVFPISRWLPAWLSLRVASLGVVCMHGRGEEEKLTALVPLPIRTPQMEDEMPAPSQVHESKYWSPAGGSVWGPCGTLRR